MLTSGIQIGPYKIVAPLGAGGMGEVYRAMDLRLGREVALKILPSQFANDPDRLARFEREAKAVAALAHPNILVLHDFGSDQGVTFVVTELLEGETLRQRIGPAGMPWRKAVELAVAIADGLAAAHVKGIVHRDLKPDNVFVTSDERVKILDFGLAKVLIDSPPIEPVETQSYIPAVTKTGAVMGTVPYMSPEQLRGQPVDARSDLFSFGCMLYEMVAGRRPFHGQTGADMSAAILHCDPAELSVSARQVPVELERTIRRCLEKNPEARFQSARDLAFALRGLASSSGMVPMASAPSRFVKWRRFAAVAAFLTMAAALAIGFWPRGPSTSDPGKPEPPRHIEVAVLPFVNGSKDPEVDYLSDGLPSGIIKCLTECGNLKVRSFSTVSRFRDQDVAEGGKKLKVQAVLTGKITSRKDRLTLNVELVNVGDDTAVWTESYDCTAAELQSLQVEIARQLVAKLKVPLTGEEETRLGKRHTHNSEAYQLYLKGRYQWLKLTQDGIRKAEEYFRQAIDKDPGYALAYAGLADTYIALPGWGEVSPKQAIPRAKDAARKALDLDANLAEAHTALGMIHYFYDRDWSAAERELKRAIELNPSVSLVVDTYAWFLLHMGRFDEARTVLKKAIDLDPVTPLINVDAGWLEYYTRQFDRAIEHASKVLEVDPNFATAFVLRGMAHLQKKQYPQALADLEKARQLDGTPGAISVLGLGHALAGNTDVARKLLEELNALAKKRYVDPSYSAWIYMGLGDKEQALTGLEKCWEDRSGELTRLNVEPVYDGLRAAPRFQVLMKKMNFPSDR